MIKLTPSTLSLSTLKRIVNLHSREMANYEWTQVDAIELTKREQQRLQELTADLLYYPVLLMSEATLLARVLYPLLLLAEQPPIRALVGVALQARYTQFEIEGIADLALAKNTMGFIESPYLIIVEAKRGIEGQNPIMQLYAHLLAAAHLNWENNESTSQEIFGGYTIADTWTFVKANISGIDKDIPTLCVEMSREYTEKLEAETIVKILKHIVSKYSNKL